MRHRSRILLTALAMLAGGCGAVAVTSAKSAPPAPKTIIAENGAAVFSLQASFTVVPSD